MTKIEILEEFTFGDVSIVAERVVGGRDIYRLRVERVVCDEVGPVARNRHLFETNITDLERLAADLGRAGVRMSCWLQEYAKVRHRKEKPKARSILGLRLGK